MTTFPPHPLDFLKSSSAMYPTNPHIQHCNLMSYSNNKPWRRLIVHVVPRLTWRIAGCARIICESRIRRTVLIARNGPGVSPGAMGKIYRFTALPGTSNCVNLSSVFFFYRDWDTQSPWSRKWMEMKNVRSHNKYGLVGKIVSMRCGVVTIFFSLSTTFCCSIY